MPLSEIAIPTLDFLYDIRRCYDDISSDRTVSFGAIGGIPFLSKITWLNEEGITDRKERVFFRRMLNQLAAEESQFFKRKSEKDTKDKK